ncbi:ornithine carbamoyltransferase [Spiroplasma clarkii]|uniref:Ornithine carbamoyltransferase n=1 Tax=Spiroplasma clarkii TaxID=2139 RepID=A0A2K8KIB8_9MOLU|nr:ornithine carbamoyltransferase [Spiroplasma clarkii]
MLNLKGRSLMTLLDFSPREIQYLLDLSRDLKRAKYAGTEVPKLVGKNIALLFQKTSTRTRCAFEVAAHDQGAHVTYIGADGSQMGIKESIADTARVLGRMYDGIQFRCFRHEDVLELDKYAGVPVFNGLSDLFHPTQMIADLMTIIEEFKTLKGIKMVFCGDAHNNVANSLMVASAKMGMHFVAAAPKHLWPEEKLIDQCKKIAKETGAILEFDEDIIKAAKDAHVIYTDIWVSMGEPDSVWDERIKLLSPYQVNSNVMKSARKDAIFLHCLPSYHDLKTDIGKKIHEKYGLKEMEVTDEVFESKKSKVFEEAENRMHSIKAIMVAMMR